MKAETGQAVAVAAVGLAIATFALTRPDVAEIVHKLGSKDWVVEAVSRAGPWLIVIFLAFAIVASPIPSGPVAIAAGALYGTVEGGFLVVVGAVIGAIIAFSLSKWFGRRTLGVSSHPIAVWLTRSRSQNMLMLAVLCSRLIPFISFDVVSYAAGLTSLATWRFAVATGLGVIPVSFGFAAMGAGSVESNNWRLVTIVACAVTVVLPASIWLWRTARRFGPRRLKIRT